MTEKFKNLIMNNKFMKNNVVKNSLIIMYGQTIASVISFFNAFLVLRVIGVYGNGVIAIAASYSSIFNGLFNFQSYNAVIKFGAEALEQNDMHKYKKYLKQAFIQDVATAILAFVVGFLCIETVGRFMKWDSQMIFYIKIYMMTILFNITGSLSALLRLHDEFKVGAIIAIRVTVIKLLILLLTLPIKLNLTFYILLEIVLTIVSNIMLFYYAFKCLKKYNCQDFLKVKIEFDKEFTMFNFYNNIVSTIDMPTGQLVNLVINKFLGVSEVGIYNVFTRFGALVTRDTTPVSQSLLPELSKLVAKGEKKNAFSIVRKIFMYTTAGGGAVIVFVVLTYKLWLGLFIPVNIKNLIGLIVYFVYLTVTSAVAGVHLLFVSLNLVRYNLPVTFICNCIYLVMLYVFATNWGLLGILLALIIQAIMIATVKLIILRNDKDKSSGGELCAS